MKKIISALMIVTVFVLVYSCSKSSSGTITGGGGGTATDCSTTSAKFAADVQPIINASCAISGCHNGTQPPMLIDFAQIAANASNINTQVQSGNMPKTGTLTAQQKKIIQCWVNNGALNN